jgi:hypothetical protein
VGQFRHAAVLVIFKRARHFLNLQLCAELSSLRRQILITREERRPEFSCLKSMTLICLSCRLNLGFVFRGLSKVRPR